MSSSPESKACHESTYLRDESASAAVVRAVAAVSNQDPRSMDPLFSAVDPDALDLVCPLRETRSGRNGITVAFPYNGYWVRLTNDGALSVFEYERPDEP